MTTFCMLHEKLESFNEGEFVRFLENDGSPVACELKVTTYCGNEKHIVRPL